MDNLLAQYFSSPQVILYVTCLYEFISKFKPVVVKVHWHVSSKHLEQTNRGFIFHILMRIFVWFIHFILPLPHVVMQVEVFHLKQRLQSMENRAPTPRKPFHVQYGEWRTNLKAVLWKTIQLFLACKSTSIVQLEAIVHSCKLSNRESQ